MSSNLGDLVIEQHAKAKEEFYGVIWVEADSGLTKVSHLRVPVGTTVRSSTEFRKIVAVAQVVLRLTDDVRGLFIKDRLGLSTTSHASSLYLTPEALWAEMLDSTVEKWSKDHTY